MKLIKCHTIISTENNWYLDKCYGHLKEGPDGPEHSSGVFEAFECVTFLFFLHQHQMELSLKLIYDLISQRSNGK